jgi:nitroimidazol reductase NimA-like FMN-containing flavoprotein (pyridoxamine 5'-phosphate oxidase superfamily)
MAQQGSLELLSDPVAQELLSSVNPARLAYTWTDGSPRVVPMWFHWTGDSWSWHRRRKPPSSKRWQPIPGWR